MRAIAIILIAAIAGVVAVSVSTKPAKSKDAGLSVSKNDSPAPGNMWRLTITGRVDSLMIENVIVNRGHCSRWLGSSKVEELPRLPHPLKFGQAFEYGNYLCDPIEVQVTTDHGSQTFTWDAFTQNSLSVWKTPKVGAWQLVLTSRADDSLAIKTVVVNRGQCRFAAIHDSELLKFGQRYILITYCNPIEVQVTTDHGSSTFTWNE